MAKDGAPHAVPVGLVQPNPGGMGLWAEYAPAVLAIP